MAGKRVYHNGWLNSLCVWRKHLSSYMEGKKNFLILCTYLPPPLKKGKISRQLFSCLVCCLKKKRFTPPLPPKYQGWNAGKGDCGHYHSHLDFSVHMYNIVVCLHKKYSL